MFHAKSNYVFHLFNLMSNAMNLQHWCCINSFWGTVSCEQAEDGLQSDMGGASERCTCSWPNDNKDPFWSFSWQVTIYEASIFKLSAISLRCSHLDTCISYPILRDISLWPLFPKSCCAQNYFCILALFTHIGFRQKVLLCLTINLKFPCVVSGHLSESNSLHSLAIAPYLCI